MTVPTRRATLNNQHFPLRVRFDASYTPVSESGCWLWTKKIDSYGYGTIQSKWKRKKAHRVAYEFYRGPIPEGMKIDHLCRVRCCVNPWHLEPVTDKENVLRGVGISAAYARRTHCKNGHELIFVAAERRRSCECRRHK